MKILISGDGCNGANEIEDEYTRLDEDGNPYQLSCYEYDYQDLPVNFTGNFTDLTNLDDFTRLCPKFANWGCFTGSFDPNGFNLGSSLFEAQIHKVIYPKETK